MGQILVRNVSDRAIANLKTVAKARGRSLQSEVREILETAGGRTHGEALAEIDRIRALLKGRTMADSLSLLREDRDR